MLGLVDSGTGAAHACKEWRPELADKSLVTLRFRDPQLIRLTWREKIEKTNKISKQRSTVQGTARFKLCFRSQSTKSDSCCRNVAANGELCTRKVGDAEENALLLSRQVFASRERRVGNLVRERRVGASYSQLSSLYNVWLAISAFYVQ